MKISEKRNIFRKNFFSRKLQQFKEVFRCLFSGITNINKYLNIFLSLLKAPYYLLGELAVLGRDHEGADGGHGVVKPGVPGEAADLAGDPLDALLGLDESQVHVLDPLHQQGLALRAGLPLPPGQKPVQLKCIVKWPVVKLNNDGFSFLTSNIVLRSYENIFSSSAYQNFCCQISQNY